MRSNADGGYCKIKTIGILLLNLGGPDSLEAVRPFLFNLFADRTIIKLGPPFLQKPLAWLISGLRCGKTEDMYRQIGGKSPLLDITSAQAKALEEALRENTKLEIPNLDFRVYVGMRYWHPFIEDAVKQMHDEGIREVLGLSLYPHYSLATTGSAVSRFNEAVKQFSMSSSCISSWFRHPLYIDALVAGIRKGMASFASAQHGEGAGSGDAEVLFSAHGLPLSIVKSGDPYVSHIQATIDEVTKKIDVRWHLSYQSKSGPVKWLGPSTDDKMRELAERGVRDLLVVPISFVSDHIETLYEIDILYKKMASGLGMRLARTESLNTQPLFINALKDLVISAVREME
ncbi:MAG TPA: ferrochelatase [Thermodesulfovibrionales bacterium]|nr:ferrochelatase [Thermodesulfovibrionales bacterium]